jgi:hypothetical protein
VLSVAAFKYIHRTNQVQFRSEILYITLDKVGVGVGADRSFPFSAVPTSAQWSGTRYAYTRTWTWVPRHTQRGYSPDMQRYATPQPVSRQPVVTRASQPIAAKPPLNNAAVYLAAAG